MLCLWLLSQQLIDYPQNRAKLLPACLRSDPYDKLITYILLAMGCLCLHAILQGLRMLSQLQHQKEKKRKESTPSGIITEASRPRGSLRLLKHHFFCS